MSAIALGAWIVAAGALGAWLGAMTFFSFVAAPRAFAVLGNETAGTYVNEVFPVYYSVGIGLGALSIAAMLVRGWTGTLDLWSRMAVGATAVATLAHAYARWVLVPQMEAAGDDAFERYHGRSVALNAAAMLAAGAAFVAVHL